MMNPTVIELIEQELAEISPKLQNIVDLMQSSGLSNEYSRLFAALADASHYASFAIGCLDDQPDDEPTQIVIPGIQNSFIPQL